MKRLSILGSTGSIGRQALQVVQENPGRFELVTLVAGGNAERLIDQAKIFKPQYVAIHDETKVKELQKALSGLKIKVLGGNEGVAEALSQRTDMTLAAIVGMAGLKPTLAALPYTKCLAIANKESVVVGGRLLMSRAKALGVKILPVDSEHNGLYQLLEGRDPSTVSKAIITASGGPFRGMSRDQLAEVTLAQALTHPNWSMGPKNTIDSATLFNKGLELMEASILFELPQERIEAWVHPQSIVHAMVQLTEGTLLMQASRPDMRVPIAHALCWPEGGESGVAPLNVQSLKQLTFESVDNKTFPALELARSCLKSGEWACLAYNIANEVAVEAFMNGRISFLGVMSIVQKIVESVTPTHWVTEDEAEFYGESVRQLALQALR